MLSRSDIVDTAHQICLEYKKQGLDITVRQLYYQFVSKALISNGQKSYKRIVQALANARLAGDFPLDLLVDRARTVGKTDCTRWDIDVEQALDQAREGIRYMPNWYIEASRWFDQETHVSVWVEKEALAGVFERPCRNLGVGLFACKGYPSHAALYEWLKATDRAINSWQEWEVGGEHHEASPDRAVVLYFGDHDPDGFQIPRSAEETLRTFMQLEGIEFELEFKRVALNLDQVQQYNPPPFIAKKTSSRYNSYLREHGTMDAWELDALTPTTLDQLIRSSVLEYFDEKVYQDIRSRVTRKRAQMAEEMSRPEWMRETLNIVSE